MPCPVCGKPVSSDNVEQPFCSERCRIIDLGNWASGNYVISTPLDPDEIADIEEEEPS